MVLMPSHLIWHLDTYYYDPRPAHESFLLILFVANQCKTMDTFDNSFFQRHELHTRQIGPL